MRTSTILIVGVAAGAFAIGGVGMAQAQPDHFAAGHHAAEITAAGGVRVVTGDRLTQRHIEAIRARRALPKLHGFVHQDFTIGINDNSVSAGRYRIIVNDTATIHNWHIFGKGVDQKTDIAGTGKSSFRVRLRAGTYTVQCDHHPKQMTFQVTVTGSPA